MNNVSKNVSVTDYDLWKYKQKLLSYKEKFFYYRNKRLESFQDLDIVDIVTKFSFKSMQQECFDFCPMYSKNAYCHQTNAQDFNCYFCYCPYYILEYSYDNKDALFKLGQCKAGSKYAYYKIRQISNDVDKACLVLSCVNCNVPHNGKFVLNRLKKKTLQ